MTYVVPFEVEVTRGHEGLAQNPRERMTTESSNLVVMLPTGNITYHALTIYKNIHGSLHSST